MDTIIGFCGYSYHTQRFYSYSSANTHSYLIRFQTEGKSKAIVNKRKILLGKGDLLLIHPEDDYEIITESTDNSGDYYLYCEGNWVDQWWARSPKPTVSRLNLEDKLISLWRLLLIEDRRPLAEKNEELSANLLRALCISLERAIHENTSTVQRPSSVIRMMRYIEEHSTSAIKLEDVAQHAELSISRAAHLFKENLGKTIIEYTQEIRLSTAIDQMKYTSMTLEQIAINCGFSTYSYFHRVFRKKFGVSPGEYRKRE